MTRPFSALTALGLAAVAALALAGCGATTSSSASDGKLNVVATTTQLTDFTSEVGGDHIELTGLLHVGASAHHFDPTPADLLALGKADVLVVNGAGLETFVDSAVEASGFKGTVITASDGIDQAEAKKISAESEADEEEADHDHAAEEDHDDHDHGDLNPHIWTSPSNAEGMVTEISKGLSKADPDNASDYSANAKAYNSKLQDLDTWIAAQFKRVPEAERVLVSGHNSLAYYLHDYNIAFAGSILPSFEDNAEPSAADIDTLVKTIKERGVRAVFSESSMSPKLARTIAKEAGVKVVDAESLYADSLGAKGSGADTYIDATIHNTQVILEAWGVTPDAVPASLK
ncbi:zinc ABC transporter solute-binding protein [Leucobacter viscericola]|uniref:Zinc ABC transporter solute-binding protein n=1 Tax=Leucobacter viscericola TaxID=2714935 RepID=A0A6G7XFW8_9MICO|nr:metal ABC transporter substrate-binding protein [Leucobacter viscericola]QIK63494.1 zinc ABC transporter solute-binding protein [Leucobacter viscericola]